MADAELVVVHTFGNRPEADMAKSALDAASIQSFVRSDDGGGMETGLWPSNGVEVVVRAEDLQAARDVLDLPATDVR
jgi:Putative prokaryotic signal transducing protein